MRRRILESLGVAAVMMALVMFLQLSSVPSRARLQRPGRRGPRRPGPAPQTAWGHPDLQGIWLDEFDTPFERPAQNADKEFFTDEERKAQDERVTADARPQRARQSGQRPGRRGRVQRGVHLGEADRPSHVPRGRPAQRANT